MPNSENTKSVYFSTDSKRDELLLCFREITENPEYQFPGDSENRSNANEFIQSQMDKFDWPEDMRFEIDDKSTHKDFMLEYYESMVEKSISHYRIKGFELTDIVAGPINLGNFEATLRSLFGEGAIILINAGLQSMMWQCGKVLVNAVVGESDKEDTFYNIDIASDFLLQIVDHASEEDPRKARQTHFNSPHAMVLAGAMADAAALFVVAHEIAHLTEDEKCSGETADELELRADAMAMEVVVNQFHEYMKSVDNNLSNNNRIRYICHFLAPILMMELWYLKRFRQSLRSGTKDICYGSYPSDLTRRDNLISILVNAGFWADIEDKYTLFSQCIDASYSLMVNHYQDEINFDIETMSVSESLAGEKKVHPKYETVVFTNEKVLALAELKKELDKKMSMHGMQVSINSDLIKHKDSG